MQTNKCAKNNLFEWRCCGGSLKTNSTTCDTSNEDARLRLTTGLHSALLQESGDSKISWKPRKCQTLLWQTLSARRPPMIFKQVSWRNIIHWALFRSSLMLSYFAPMLSHLNTGTSRRRDMQMTLKLIRGFNRENGRSLIRTAPRAHARQRRSERNLKRLWAEFAA